LASTPLTAAKRERFRCLLYQERLRDCHEIVTKTSKVIQEKGVTKMNFAQIVFHLSIYSLYLFLPSNVPGQGLLDSIAAFITGPFGKAITLIAIVLCGVSYMYGKQSDNAHIGRVAIGAALIVGAANIFAYIQQAG
jgi:type IV secretory pathway VirB2 component (pilin)